MFKSKVFLRSTNGKVESRRPNVRFDRERPRCFIVFWYDTPEKGKNISVMCHLDRGTPEVTVHLESGHQRGSHVRFFRKNDPWNQWKEVPVEPKRQS